MEYRDEDDELWEKPAWAKGGVQLKKTGKEARKDKKQDTKQTESSVAEPRKAKLMAQGAFRDTAMEEEETNYNEKRNNRKEDDFRPTNSQLMDSDNSTDSLKR